MSGSRTALGLAAALAVTIGGWVGYGSKQIAIKDAADVVALQSDACSIDRSLKSGLRGYLPKQSPTPLTNLAFSDADGNPVSLADFRGTGVVMNFWATWCAPCVEEMPALDRLDAELKKVGSRVIALNEDRKPYEAAPAFYDANGLTSLDIYADVQMGFAREAGISAYPTTLLINRKGEEIAAVLGSAAWDDPDIVSFVKQCLAADAG